MATTDFDQGLTDFLAGSGGPPAGGPPAGGATAGQVGAVSPWAQFIQGILSLGTARTDVNAAGAAAGMADPWGNTNRSHYQDLFNQYMHDNQINPAASTARSSNAYDMLQGLLKNPGSLVTQPGYQFGLDQALEGVNRGAGASGMLNSGNRLMALQDRGQKYAGDWEDRIYRQLLGNVGAANATDALGLNAQAQGFNQLALPAGITQSNPGLAAQLTMQGRNQQVQSLGAGAGGVAAGLAGILPIIQRMLGGGGGGGLDLTGGGGGSINPGITDNYLETLFPGGSATDITAGLNLDPGADWASLFAGLGGP